MSALVWFRRDLRIDDNVALSAALASHEQVYAVFVFDTDILAPLPRRDRRVEFIWHSVAELATALRESGGGLLVRHGRAQELIPQLAETLQVDAVYANRDYEPGAIARDAAVQARLKADHRQFLDFKDQVIFDRAELLNRSGKPFSVFTPYKRAWLAALTPGHLQSHGQNSDWDRLARLPDQEAFPGLPELGFETTDLSNLRLPVGMSGAAALFDDFLNRIDHYAQARDCPAVKGPSYLSTHLRFGTISIRQLLGHAMAHGGSGAETWVSELIWREFYQMLLWHHPHVVGQAFKPEYDAVQWRQDPASFAAWCAGQTGYPLVDAAMRQLNQTGYQHNRLRMVTASFLTKDLGIDWRLGEAYFAEKLNDFDLAANNGGWQWAASTGCDAQPWFRIFNPVTQSEKFDPQGKFIRRYVPELTTMPDKFIHAPWQLSVAEQNRTGVLLGRDYPMPLVDHASARLATLERYKVATRGERDLSSQ